MAGRLDRRQARGTRGVRFSTSGLSLILGKTGLTKQRQSITTTVTLKAYSDPRFLVLVLRLHTGGEVIDNRSGLGSGENPGLDRGRSMFLK